MIRVGEGNFILLVQNAAEMLQDRCCYSEVVSYYIYGSGAAVVSESVNSTICTNSYSVAPFCACSDELTFYFNNHSHLSSDITASCFELFIVPHKEENNCFFVGSSCSGTYPVAHDSESTDCVLTKFNFANNTDSDGYFYLGGINRKRIKESVIAFMSSTHLKWIHPSSNWGGTLSIEKCYLIAASSIDGEGWIELVDGTKITLKASTHTPFDSHSKDKHCWNSSKNFSNSSQITFNIATLLNHAAANLAVAISLTI